MTPIKLKRMSFNFILFNFILLIEEVPLIDLHSLKSLVVDVKISAVLYTLV